MSMMRYFYDKQEVAKFDSIRIGIASPDEILSWSRGEVKKPETINYRTFKPERGGLFCARIFGPVRDYECSCGKYRRMKHKGIVCEKCGVEVTLAKVRRERMGHISLAAPVAHIWFLRSLPSRIGLLLDMTLRNLERVLYFDNYVVVTSGNTPLKPGELLSDEQYQDALREFGHGNFEAMIGARAVHHLLTEVDLEEEATFLREDIKEVTSETKQKKMVKKLKLVEQFIHSGARPEWMILHELPVIPPDLRPLVPLDGGRFATSDLNDLYRRIINRNNRLKRLIDLKAPDLIIRNETRMLQESVDALFDNGRLGRAITGSNKRPLKSLSDMLKGKQGRFRQNLLGKRVDYSGRSVIVVGPELKLHQCGLPKKMALELFKPFVLAKLESYDHALSLKAAKKLVERERSEVWDILEQVIREHPVLLNRAPTLHRLGIQAFEPVLVEGKAIQLHPLVCTAFNADFDGDQMAVHVPMSLEAQLEARVLMISTNNILSPASGKPIIVPSQDIVLGLYYLSLQRVSARGEGMIFSSVEEMEHALSRGVLDLQASIQLRMSYVTDEGRTVYGRVQTTAGRVKIAEFLPLHENVPFSLINRVLTKKDISHAMDVVYRHCGQKETVLFADRMMRLGFREACRAGVSIGKDDLIIPRSKNDLVQEANQKAKDLEQQYLDGLITQGEKYNKVVDLWTNCTDAVADEMMGEITPQDKGKKGFNSVYMMAHSGARSSRDQLKQLAGMRGPMARPSGEIIETPIISNFKEGLSVLEYFNSTHGARKGLADTALKTANSGYLTRRLVDVAQDCIITEEDCGTHKGIAIEAVIEGGETISSLYDRVLGRCAAEDIVSVRDGKVLASAGTLIDEKIARSIEDDGVTRVLLRSVLTCESRTGCCARCYGRDLARGVLVNIGEAVGVIAAQSIGEPGTQLTMRTFHIGGAAQRGAEESSLKALCDGTLRLNKADWVQNDAGRLVALSRYVELVLEEGGKERSRHRLPVGTIVPCKNGAKVKAGDLLAEWDPYNVPIIAKEDGTVRYEDITPGLSMRQETDETTGIVNNIITDWRQRKGSELKPSVVVTDEKGKEHPYYLMVDMILSVDDKQKVKKGDILARSPREYSKTRDITGGLPRVAELFEARKPKDVAVLAAIDGVVEMAKDFKGKRRVAIIPDEGEEGKQEYLIGKDRHLLVREGDRVSRGDLLVEGDPLLQDILDISGVEAMAHFLTKEIQDVYRLQGVKIDDKHVEVIMRQMMRKVEIVDAGDSHYLESEQLDVETMRDLEEQLQKEGKNPPRTKRILLGITKAALNTRSFISAASFQETTRVLTEAAVSGKEDVLAGLKENVIVGRLIPAGTGCYMNQLLHEALERDRTSLAERQKQEMKSQQPEPMLAAEGEQPTDDGQIVIQE